MDNILVVGISNPNEIARQIAARVRERRLELDLTQEGMAARSGVKFATELDLTQEGMAARSGVKFATYRRFEQTGEISLKGLLQIGFALNALSDFDALFSHRQYQSLNDVLNEQNVVRKKRGKKNE